ncbi:MAG: hypothetical protein AAFX62_11510 [Pseudomonadota bacterium]
MRYVEVRRRLDVPWSDVLTSVRVTEKDILVELPDGSTLETFGRMTYAGKFRTSQPRLWAIKPKNWPEQDSDAYVAPVFQIPEEITSVVLKIGDLFETVIEIPEPTDMDHPADFARFEILGHRRFDGFKRDGSGTHKQRSWELVLPDGFTLLELDIAMTGLMANNIFNEKTLSWRGTDFDLVDTRGVTMGWVGERWSNTIHQEGVGTIGLGETEIVKLIWLVPEDLQEFRLLFGDREIGRL